MALTTAPLFGPGGWQEFPGEDNGLILACVGEASTSQSGEI